MGDGAGTGTGIETGMATAGSAAGKSSAPAAAAGNAPKRAATDDEARTGGEAMIRSEERMHVSTERQQSGRARLRKYVVTE